MQVTLVYSPVAREVHKIELDLPEGATAADALRASGWLERFKDVDDLSLAVWGRRCAPSRLRTAPSSL